MGVVADIDWVVHVHFLRHGLGSLPQIGLDAVRGNSSRARNAPRNCSPDRPHLSDCFGARFSFALCLLIFFRRAESFWWARGWVSPAPVILISLRKSLSSWRARLVIASSRARPPSLGSTSIRYPSLVGGAAGLAFLCRAALSRALSSLLALQIPTPTAISALSLASVIMGSPTRGPTGLFLSSLAISWSNPSRYRFSALEILQALSRSACRAWIAPSRLSCLRSANCSSRFSRSDLWSPLELWDWMHCCSDDQFAASASPTACSSKICADPNCSFFLRGRGSPSSSISIFWGKHSSTPALAGAAWTTSASSLELASQLHSSTSPSLSWSGSSSGPWQTSTSKVAGSTLMWLPSGTSAAASDNVFATSATVWVISTGMLGSSWFTHNSCFGSQRPSSALTLLLVLPACCGKSSHASYLNIALLGIGWEVSHTRLPVFLNLQPALCAARASTTIFTSRSFLQRQACSSGSCRWMSLPMQRIPCFWIDGTHWRYVPCTKICGVSYSSRLPVTVPSRPRWCAHSRPPQTIPLRCPASPRIGPCCCGWPPTQADLLCGHGTWGGSADLASGPSPLEIWGIPPSRLRGEVPGTVPWTPPLQGCPSPCSLQPSWGPFQRVLPESTSSGPPQYAPPKGASKVPLWRDRGFRAWNTPRNPWGYRAWYTPRAPQGCRGFQQSQLSPRNLI